MHIVLTIFFSLAALGSRCQGPEIVSIELSKVSRGYEEHVRLTPDSLTVFIENKVQGADPVRKAQKLMPEQWSRVVGSLANVELREVAGLPSPSMDRASDAAMHSQLSITTSGGEKFEHGFDGERPHGRLIPLLKAIRELTGPSEKP